MESNEYVLVKLAYNYVTKKVCPDGCAANKKRQIRKKAEKFRVLNGELFYKPTNKQVGVARSLTVYRTVSTLPSNIECVLDII